MFSRRSSVDPGANRLAEALQRMQQAGEPILDLTVGNPTQAGIAYPEREILEALANPDALVYRPEPFGIASARAAVADDRRLDPGRLVLTASTSEAYSFLFRLLCDPADQILVPRPSYPLFEHLARLDGVELVPYWLRYDDGAWAIDLDDVRRAVGPRARGLVVVNPNHPTGSYVKRDELMALSGLGLPLISDEVFADYPLGDGGHRVRTALEAEGALVFALGGLSKLVALPQLKLAWIAVGGPEAAVAEALTRLELIADTFLSVGTPVQLALPKLLSLREPVQRAVLARCAGNLDWLRERGRESQLTVLYVEGGWYAPVRLPGPQPEPEWAQQFLEQDRVLTQPGWFFDFAADSILVLSLLTPEPAFREGFRRMERRVAAAWR
jgi:alanine-synthesizing transaminase